MSGGGGKKPVEVGSGGPKFGSGRCNQTPERHTHPMEEETSAAEQTAREGKCITEKRKRNKTGGGKIQRFQVGRIKK